MQADFSVDLGRDAPALEIPWHSNDPQVRYYDLKSHPELMQQIPEAQAYPELASFLGRINAAGLPLATAKCDVWSSREVAPEEEIFGDRKFVSYIDLVFVDQEDRCSFEKHEVLVRELCRLLFHAPEIPATVELVIRHCYYHREEFASEKTSEPSGPQSSATEGATASVTGFCITAYMTGFGDHDHDPVRRWAIGLHLLQNAIVQLNLNSQPKQ
ncbi:MAG TPA: hypothetical protein VGK01_07335 [Candidatus Angelobacter sp.]|jgi:hypothetical protein